MTRGICAGALLLALALGGTGCAWGYVTYFRPALAGGRAVPHPDPTMRPPPPAGVELASGAVSVRCANVRKFVLLPLPWLRRGFRPAELQVEVAFASEPRSVSLDLGNAGLSVGGASVWPSRVEYEGRRPPPKYLATVPLPIGGRARLDSPNLLTLVFDEPSTRADSFRLRLGELVIDGTHVAVPPLEFSRGGEFVSYRSPGKKKVPAEDAGEPAAGDDL